MPTSLDTVAFSIVMGLIGLILAYTGYDRLGLARILKRRARREPSSVAAGEEALIESPVVPDG